MLSENQKLLSVKPKIRYCLIISLALLAITLLVTWLVSCLAYYSVVNDILKFITIKTTENRFGFQLSLLSWSISYIVIFVANVLFLFFIMFLKTSNQRNGLMTIGWLIALIVELVGMLLFIASLVPDLPALEAEYGTQKLILFLVPNGLITFWLALSFVFTIILTHQTMSQIVTKQKWSFLKKSDDLTNVDEITVEHEKQSETNIIMPNLATNFPSNNQVFSNVDHTHTINQDIPTVEQKNQFNTVDYTHTMNIEPEKQSQKIKAEKTAIPPNATDFLVVKESEVAPIKLEEIIWTPTQINEVWAKGQIIPNVNPKLYRKDYAGAWMFFDSFVQTLPAHENYKSYDWTIVHHRPRTHGGESVIDNLEPMNVHNAATKGENYPRWETKITSIGNENRIKVQTWKARNTE